MHASCRTESGQERTRCAIEEVESRRGVDTRRCASKDFGPNGELIEGSHIDWRRE